MHIKNIRKIVNKQLKTKHPHWKSMTRKIKKVLAKDVVDEVVKNYDYSQTLDLPIEQLTGIDNQNSSGRIRSLLEMADFINNFHSDNLFYFDKRKKLYPEIIDPEFSYRKFCTDEYFGRERIQNRRFVRLPLNTKAMADHTELSHFRTGLHFRQVMNVFVYILHYFYKSDCLENTVIHGVDSTELPAEINYPLCTGKVKNQMISGK